MPNQRGECSGLVQVRDHRTWQLRRPVRRRRESGGAALRGAPAPSGAKRWHEGRRREGSIEPHKIPSKRKSNHFVTLVSTSRLSNTQNLIKNLHNSSNSTQHNGLSTSAPQIVHPAVGAIAPVLTVRIILRRGCKNGNKLIFAR